MLASMRSAALHFAGRYRRCLVIGFLLKLLLAKLLLQYLEDRNVSFYSAKPRVSRGNDYVAICALARNELDVNEWVEYHRLLGVGKIYFHDEMSAPRMRAQIQRHIDDEFVDYRVINFYWNDFKHLLSAFFPSISSDNELGLVFNSCLREHGSKHRWIAFIDVDEYLVATNNRTLPEVLSAYEEYGGLVVNWNLFGSSGHISRPKGKVVDNYRKCAMFHVVKTIAQPRHARHIGINPHYFVYDPPFYAVNEARVRTDGASNSPELRQHLYLNHYRLKSLEDYKLKQARWGNNFSGKQRNSMTLDFFYKTDNHTTGDCDPPRPPRRTDQ